MMQPETKYTGTKIDNERWCPIRGVDWSNEIKILPNVKNAHQLAEKKLRERLVNKVVKEYNECTISLNQMKDQLSLYWDQIKLMQANMKTWSQNVAKMEGKQGVLQLKLLELGIDVSSLQKEGPAIEGLHFMSEVPISTASTVSTAPTATVSTPTDLGEPVNVEQSTSSTTVADIHPTPPSSTTVSSTVEGQAAAVTSSSTVDSPSASRQIIPLTAAQILQLITPGASAVGGPQQIINIGGQNVLVFWLWTRNYQKLQCMVR